MLLHFTGVVVQAPFQPAGDGVRAAAAAIAVHPAEALRLNARALWFRPDVLAGIGRAVSFSEGVATGNQRHGLLSSFIAMREKVSRMSRADASARIGLSIGSFRIHVNQTHHLNGPKGFVQLAFAAVARSSASHLPSGPQKISSSGSHTSSRLAAEAEVS